MLPKQHRLTGPEVRFVVKRGQGFTGPSLRVKIALSRGLISHATVVASLAVDKRSTQRNRIKRQIRAILAPVMKVLKPPVNIAVFISKNAKNKTTAELSKELRTLLKMARVLA